MTVSKPRLSRDRPRLLSALEHMCSQFSATWFYRTSPLSRKTASVHLAVRFAPLRSLSRFFAPWMPSRLARGKGADVGTKKVLHGVHPIDMSARISGICQVSRTEALKRDDNGQIHWCTPTRPSVNPFSIPLPFHDSFLPTLSPLHTPLFAHLHISS